jgi:hypothetical protein
VTIHTITAEDAIESMPAIFARFPIFRPNSRIEPRVANHLLW